MSPDTDSRKSPVYVGFLYGVVPFLLIVGTGLFAMAMAAGWISDCEMLLPLAGGIIIIAYCVWFFTAVRRKSTISRWFRIVLMLVALGYSSYGGVLIYRFLSFQALNPCRQGIRLLMSCHRCRCAEKEFRKAERQGAEASCLAYGWGVLRFVEKDYPTAEKQLKEALELDPARNDARYQLSRTYKCMGRDEDARALLESYLENGGGTYTSQARDALEKPM